MGAVIAEGVVDVAIRGSGDVGFVARLGQQQVMVGTVALGCQVAGRQGFKDGKSAVGMVMDQAVRCHKAAVIAVRVTTTRDHSPKNKHRPNKYHQLSH